MTASYTQLYSKAARKAGAFTREMGHQAGFSDKQIRSRVSKGEWVKVLPGVYRAASTPVANALREHAALEYVGPQAFLSHESGSAVWDLIAQPAGVTVSAPVEKVLDTPHWLTLVRTRHPEFVTSRGLRVATASRCVADLAMTHSRGYLAAVLAAGVQSGKVSVDDVRTHAVTLRGRPGGADLNSVLEEFDPAFESVLGRELCDVLREAGVVDFHAGDRIDLPGGRYRLGDAVIRELRLDFEADGFAYHGTKEQQDADKARDIELGLALYRTIRFTTDALRRRRAETIALIPSIVEARGREIGYLDGISSSLNGEPCVEDALAG